LSSASESTPGSSPPLTLDESPRALYWQVPQAGFCWRDDLDFDARLSAQARTRRQDHGLYDNFLQSPWLVSRRGPQRLRPFVPASARAMGREWPLDLHRQLAALEPTQESILRFANRFGFLGHTVRLKHRAESDVLDTWNIWTTGESFQDWVAEIGTARDLVHAWDLIRAKDQWTLRRYVSWSSEAVNWTGPHWLEGDDHFTNIARQYHNGGMSPLGYTGPAELRDMGWQHGEVLRPALYYVATHINSRLWHHARALLVPLRRSDIPAIPTSLLGIIYLRFAQEIAGAGAKQQPCARCGGLFSPQRSDQVYCSSACRKARYYHHTVRPKRSSTTSTKVASEGESRRGKG